MGRGWAEVSLFDITNVRLEARSASRTQNHVSIYIKSALASFTNHAVHS